MRPLLGLAALALALWLVLQPAVAAPPPRAQRRLSAEPAVNLSNSPGVVSGRPKMARTQDGTLHVVWEEGPNLRHVYKASGKAWGPTPALTVWYSAFDAALTAYRDQLAVAFVVQGGQATDTLARVRLWDGQGKWAKAQPVALDLGLSGQQQPDLAIQPDDGSVWVAWVNNRFGYTAYYSHLVAGQAPEVGEVGHGGLKAQGPSVAVDEEGGVWVAWKEEAEPTNDSWVTCRRRPRGGNFELCNERTDVLRGETYEAFAPDLALGAPGACITWHNGMLSDRSDVYLACDGANWAARNVSQSPDRNSLSPRLTLERPWGPLVAWEERLAPSRILYRPGQSPPAAVAEAPSAGWPAVAFEPLPAQGFGYLHTVWEAVNPADPAGASDIYYTRWRVDVPTPTPTPTATFTPTRTSTPTSTPSVGTPGTPGSPTTTAGTPAPRRVFAPFVVKPPVATRNPSR